MTAWQELRFMYRLRRVHFSPMQALRKALKATKGPLPF